MSVPDDLTSNPHYIFYKEVFEGLDNATLRQTVSDHAKTLEYVKKNVEQEEPEKANDTEYIESIVTEMQKVGKEILETRS